MLYRSKIGKRLVLAVGIIFYKSEVEGINSAK
jgi:hypothetical protein